MINSSSNRFLHYLYLSVLSTVLFLGACKSYSYDKAKEEYDKGYYATAAQEATEVSKDRKIDKESKNKAYLLAAESYRMSNDYKNAVNTSTSILNTILKIRMRFYTEQIA